MTTHHVTYKPNGLSGVSDFVDPLNDLPYTIIPYEPNNTRWRKITGALWLRHNYHFSHWNTSSTNSGTKYLPGSTYGTNANLTLYAIWNPLILYSVPIDVIEPEYQEKSYGVALKLRGAVSRGSDLAWMGTLILNGNGSGSNLTRNFVCERRYTFTGWKFSVNNTVYAAGGTLPASQNTSGTMTAQFSTSTFRHSVTLPSVTRDGYEFLGWTTNSAGTGTVYAAGTGYTPSADTVTLYAKWRPIISKAYVSSISVIRVASSDSYDESDDGTVAYLKVVVKLSGGATSLSTLTVGASVTSSPSKTITSQSYTGAATTRTFEWWVTGCSANSRYSFTVTISVNGVTGQTISSFSKSALLPMSFYTFDAYAGGHGVAFGEIAEPNIFKVAFDKFRLVADSNNELMLDFKSAYRTGNFIRLYGGPSGSGGDGIVIGNGGYTGIGGGESAYNLYNALVDEEGVTPGYERMVISNDQAIQFYSNCDVVANRKRMDFTTGGNLFLYDGSLYNYGGNNIFVKCRNIDRNGTEPEPDAVWDCGYNLVDVDGDTIGYMHGVRTPGGNQILAIYSTNGDNNNQPVSNGLQIGVDRAGNPSIAATSPSAWRKMLGMGSGGAYPITIAQGGTGATSASVARTNLGTPGVVTDGSYFGFMTPSANEDVYMRAPKKGFIPYASGASQSCTLGTSGWPWTSVHAKNFYRDGKQLGAYVTASNMSTSVTSMANSTYKSVRQATLGPGVWVITGGIRYNANATGQRHVYITPDSNVPPSDTNRDAWGMKVNACASGITLCHTTAILDLGVETTIYLLGYQNSGSSLAVGHYMRAVRVG